MLRKLVCGLMVVALVFCVRAAWVAGAADDKDIASQVREGLKTLDGNNDRTAASRLGLAKVAIGAAQASKDPQVAADAYDAAREALEAAARLEPNNKEVADLLQTVLKHIPPATRPATNPTVATPTTKPGPETKPGPLGFIVKREVSPAELNRIRQLEWRADENPKPSLRVEPETRKKFLAASPDVMPGDFNKKTPDAQARDILDSGKQEFYGGVHINTDPASIREFKIAVERVVVQNCSTAGCHSANKAGRFNLFTDKSDAATYSNFLILQKYAAVVNGTERLMVDRTTPESSLLLQFMLPPEQTDAPHPQVPGFKPPVRNKNDPRYQQVLKWLKTLDPLAPNYGIDLTADEPAADVAPKK